MMSDWFFYLFTGFYVFLAILAFAAGASRIIKQRKKKQEDNRRRNLIKLVEKE